MGRRSCHSNIRVPTMGCYRWVAVQCFLLPLEQRLGEGGRGGEETISWLVLRMREGEEKWKRGREEEEERRRGRGGKRRVRGG